MKGMNNERVNVWTSSYHDLVDHVHVYNEMGNRDIREKNYD